MSVGKTTLVNALRELPEFKDYNFRTERSKYLMEMGIPLTTIANTIQLAGVMEGKHSVDTGLLSLPVIIETMMLIGDSASVKYNTGMEDAPRSSSETMARRNVEKLYQEDMTKQSKDDEVVDDIIEEEKTVEPMVEEKEEPMGLMQRRA